MVTILKYLTNWLSFLSDFWWNENKNKQKQPLLYSLFQDSEETRTSTETNNTSYESPDTQLFGARRMRAWHYHGGATPTSHKTVCYCFFWGRGSQEGWIFDFLFLIRSKFRISWMSRYHFSDLLVHFWWPNKRFIWGRSSWKTLYSPTVVEGKTFVLVFCQSEKLCKVYIQDKKD